MLMVWAQLSTLVRARQCAGAFAPLLNKGTNDGFVSCPDSISGYHATGILESGKTFFADAVPTGSAFTSIGARELNLRKLPFFVPSLKPMVMIRAFMGADENCIPVFRLGLRELHAPTLMVWAQLSTLVRTRHCAGLLIPQCIPIRLRSARGFIFGFIRANFFVKPIEPPRTVAVLPDFAHCLVIIARLVNAGVMRTYQNRISILRLSLCEFHSGHCITRQGTFA
jgi:hypothetical protein